MLLRETRTWVLMQLHVWLYRDGFYCGVLSGLPLFRGSDKYDSGTGWPSFSNPFDDDHIIKVVEPDGAT